MNAHLDAMENRLLLETAPEAPSNIATIFAELGSLGRAGVAHGRERGVMRLLVYNPNTNRALTTALGNAVQRLLRSDDVLQTATSDAGEAFIGSDESIAVARAALQSDLPRRALDCDAILLGYFGDLSIDEIRRELRRPIVSLSEAFFATAPFLGRRIGLLTTSAYWAGRLALKARRKDVVHWIVETRSLESSRDEGSVSLAARCRSAIAEIAKDGRCEAVVLAGAMLIAPSRELAPPLPLVDPLAAGVALCRTACEILTSRQRLAQRRSVMSRAKAGCRFWRMRAKAQALSSSRTFRTTAS